MISGFRRQFSVFSFETARQPKEDTTLEFEFFLSAADSSIESMVGRADENFESISELYPGDSPERKELELSRSEEDEDSMKRLCPGLWERFGERAFLLYVLV